MRYLNFTAAALLSLTSLSAVAQTPAGMDPATGARPSHEPGTGESEPHSTKASNIGSGGRQVAVAPTLPKSGLGTNAASADYLRVARSALVAGRTGQAQQSLEMAETRALDRSVPEGETRTPSDSQLVARIGEARHALGDRDRTRAIEAIDQALAL